tara:strand:+ start:321 stop:635 length:315 start_codon:yes stop_codon:yes gene_type:complete
MENIGKATAVEITALKAKHGEVHEVTSVKYGITHFTYVKKPDLEIISAAAAYAESDPIKSGEIMFNSTRIAGSEVVVTDAEMKLGVIKYIGSIFKVVEAAGKKL